MAVDITTQTWYSSAASPTENKIAMDAYLVENYDPLNLTDAQTDALIKFNQQLDMMAKALTVKVDGFNAAKQSAFDALHSQHNQEMVDLGILWQSYEDNDYTIG